MQCERCGSDIVENDWYKALVYGEKICVDCFNEEHKDRTYGCGFAMISHRKGYYEIDDMLDELYREYLIIIKKSRELKWNYYLKGGW